MVVRGHSLSREAEAFRDKILKLFCPRASRKRAHATVQTLAALVYNGDWRQRSVIHVCTGCCTDCDESKRLALAHVQKLLLALKFKMLSRSDWALWPDALALIGFLAGFHNLFGVCFLKAFAHLETSTLQPDSESVEDASHHYRLELSQNVKHAMDFWKSEPSWRLQLFMMGLHEQKHTMTDILHLASVSHELDLAQQLLHKGPSLERPEKEPRFASSILRHLFQSTNSPCSHMAVVFLVTTVIFPKCFHALRQMQVQSAHVGQWRALGQAHGADSPDVTERDKLVRHPPQ